MNENAVILTMGAALLACVEAKLHLVRDHVMGVVKKYKAGYFLYGSGGIGKSFTVLSFLKLLEISYVLHNSRMTAKGLFLQLKEARSAIHVIEDTERLLNDADAQGVLRSATWAQPGHERIIKWTTAKGPEEFTFSGGIIMISNRPLGDMPELRALATRIEVHRLELTEEEMKALMFDLASRGHRQGEHRCLTPAECIEVTEFLWKECRAAATPLDLRLQQKSYQSYLQWDAGFSKCHWHDLITASVREAVQHFRHEPDPASPEAKLTKKRNVLRAINQETSIPKTREERYCKEARASRADYFRRKAEVESGEFDQRDAQ